MKHRGLWAAGIAVMCLPMLFAVWLLLACQWPRMDASTVKLPMGLRSAVAEVLAQRAGSKNEERARRLDPDVTTVRLEDIKGEDVKEVHIGEQVMSSDAKTLDREGQAQEAKGDECSAMATYIMAESKEDASDSIYTYAEHKGRAALMCGKLGDAQAGLEKAVAKEDKLLHFTVGDKSATSAALLKDREWLIVVYDRVGEPSFAARTCAAAHPGWESCACALKGKDVSCASRQ